MANIMMSWRTPVGGQGTFGFEKWTAICPESRRCFPWSLSHDMTWCWAGSSHGATWGPSCLTTPVPHSRWCFQFHSGHWHVASPSQDSPHASCAICKSAPSVHSWKHGTLDICRDEVHTLTSGPACIGTGPSSPQALQHHASAQLLLNSMCLPI